MTISTVPQKRARESSSSFTDEDNNVRKDTGKQSTRPPKKRRNERESRYQRQGRRIQQFQSTKKLETLDLSGDDDDEDDDDDVPNEPKSDSEYHPTSPIRPSISPLEETTTTTVSRSTQTSRPFSTSTSAAMPQFTTTTNPLLPTLNQISKLIRSNDLATVSKLLVSITKTPNWQTTASRDSLIKISNYTQLLGDGKRQGLEQARIINDLRRKQMELEEGVRSLARENARLKAGME